MNTQEKGLKQEDFAHSMNDALEAIQRLPKCNNFECAEKFYWFLDNNVIVQGTLFPSAIKLFPAICEAVISSNQVGRHRLLDLIVEIVAAVSNDMRLNRLKFDIEPIRDSANEKWLESVASIYALTPKEVAAIDDIRECMQDIG